MPFKSNDTITFDLTSLQIGKDYDYIREESLYILVTNKEIPLKAIIKDGIGRYTIKQHTTQVERTYNQPVFVYICEEI